MKTDPHDLITETRAASTLEYCELKIKWEAGKVVHVHLGESIQNEELFARLAEVFGPLTGGNFYGTLRLPCTAGRIKGVLLNPSIKVDLGGT